jgi:phosphoribosylformimino-5-aminoimidazole carboxamide ribotide isomerase
VADRGRSEVDPPPSSPESGPTVPANQREPRTFVVIPAVDVLDGEAVRLAQGDFDRVTHAAGDPAGLAARYAAAGAALIHVVDLDGARHGRIRPDLVSRLAEAAAPVPIQASGGIRSVADAETLLAAGAARVIVGTAAFAEPAALEGFAAALDNRLVVALDARDGRLALSGWLHDSGIAVEQAAELCAAAGVRRLHCTAVDRDGTMAGPDLDLLARVRDRSGLPVLAAGGIRSEADLVRLSGLGLEGAVVGRALLEGTIPLEALRRQP